MDHSANCKQQLKEESMQSSSLTARRAVTMYCCHGTGEAEKAAFQHKRQVEVSLLGVLKPAGWKAERKAFKSGKSWRCEEGEEVRAIREKVFA